MQNYGVKLQTAKKIVALFLCVAFHVLLVGEHGMTDISLNTSVSPNAVLDPFLPATMAYGDMVPYDNGGLYCGGGFYSGGGVNSDCTHFDINR